MPPGRPPLPNGSTRKRVRSGEGARIDLELPPDLAAKLDSVRGDLSRAAFLRRLLSSY